MDHKITSKLFCSKCGYRIWREFDGQSLRDDYRGDRHLDCDISLARNPPYIGDDLDFSYVEAK